MPDGVILRRGGQADHDRIMEVWREASRVGHPFLSEEDLAAQERVTRREHLPKADLVVAELDGALVGFIAALGERIGGLFVAPQAQRFGIGRRLVEHAQARSASLELAVYEANLPARAFYARLGFRPVGRSDRDDEDRPLPVIRLAWDGGARGSSRRV